MKIISLFFYVIIFISLKVNAWEIARPSLEGYYSIAFRQSYVKYRIIKDVDAEKGLGQIMEINLHDQILRKGYFYQRIWNNWVGTLGTPLGTFVEENVLARTLLLVSKIPIEANTSFYNWILQPNFSLLDSRLVADKEKIAASFHKEFPTINIIRFWIGDKDFPHHTLSLFKVIIKGDHQEWINIFKNYNVDLQLNPNLDEISNE